MPYVVLDFETRSWCDLKKTGAWVYAGHPTTEVICLGYQLEGAEPQQWVPQLYQPPGVQGLRWGNVVPTALGKAIDDGFRLVAHNVVFERAVWEEIMVPLYSWPRVPPEQWYDTMASCAYRAIPLKLEMAAKVLGLEEQKGKTPSRYFKPDKKTGLYPTKGIEVVYDYNLQDLRTETAVLGKLRALPPAEMAVWQLDQKINARGVQLDLDFIRSSQTIVDRATVPLLAEFKELTGFDKTGSPKLIEWVEAHGVKLPNMQAGTIDSLLGVDDEDDDDEPGHFDLTGFIPDIPPNVRRALEIRRILGSASIKKLRAMANCIGPDGRARGAVQYHAASTGRWGGRLFQPQNFPRGKIKIKYKMDDLIACIRREDPVALAAMFETDAISAVATALRHAIVAKEGHVLNVGDFSTVEARIVLALAGQWDKVDLLSSGGDPYCDIASQIYDAPVDKKAAKDENHPQHHWHLEARQTGKNSVLGLGFQMGKDKFHARYCEGQELEFAERIVSIYRKEWAPEVPNLWAALEDAALRAVWDRRPHEAYGIRYQLEEGWLTCRLPSGRKLWYYDPKPVRKEMKWSTPENPDIRRSWTYRARKAGRMTTIDAYGGHLTENVVQATARDLLTHAMARCEAENLPIVLTVHDEIVCEVPAGSRQADPKLLEQIMKDRPQWAVERRIPVDAECWMGARYRK